MANFGAKLAHAWNAFKSQDEDTNWNLYDPPSAYVSRPDRRYFNVTNERMILTSILTRIAIDVANIEFKHIRTDENGRYAGDIKSGLNYCLTQEANIDQAPRHFRQDAALTCLEEGVVALVPVDTTLNPDVTGSFDIQTMRVGVIKAWYKDRVKVSVYNDQKGKREDVILDKRFIAIVENPLYSVMNEPNSTLKRLMRKLSLLDAVDEQSSSGKLDLIIQLPYAIKSEARREQAENRRKDIEFQMKNSKYGIAYTDATEKVTQLNRPAENNLLKQVEYLTAMLYAQLGITEEVMNGTADEKAMKNYHNRTVKPILTAMVEAMRRSFLTKTARTQGQDITFFIDPFELLPISDIAEIADKFSRNEILTSNEIRQVIGFKPSSDPKADQLVNSNMPAPSESAQPTDPIQKGAVQNGTGF